MELQNDSAFPAALPEIQSQFVDNKIYDGFDKNKKIKFLELYRNSPNITGCAEAVGHSRQLIFYHLERDVEFKRAFDAVREGLTDQLEARVHEFAQRPTNVIDRLAWLRAYRPGVWNPARDSQVQVNVDVTHRLASEAKNYIDTTASEAGTSPKDSPIPLPSDND